MNFAGKWAIFKTFPFIRSNVSTILEPLEQFLTAEFNTTLVVTENLPNSFLLVVTLFFRYSVFIYTLYYNQSP